jgi:hypothetical protein
MAKSFSARIKEATGILRAIWELEIKGNLLPELSLRLRNGTWRVLFMPRPRTVKAAVRYLLAGLDQKNRDALKAMKRNDLILLHHGFGAGVRHNLGLWGQNQALMNDPELKGMHPDDMSMILIEKLWEHLKEMEKG